MTLFQTKYGASCRSPTRRSTFSLSIPDASLKDTNRNLLCEHHMTIEDLINSYPRIRPPLTVEHARIYEEQYRLNRDGGQPIESLAQRLELWMHRQVAGRQDGAILELGAGTLNHVRHERRDVAYDVVEPFHLLYEGRSEIAAVRDFFDTVNTIPCDRRYSRIISIAVLEHMEDLPRDIARAAMHLNEGGVFQAGIPSEGGLLWWLGWRFSTGISYYLRTKLDYGVVMRHEHLNSAPEIIAVIRHMFSRVQVRRFPLPWHQTSFYAYIEASDPIRERCDSISALPVVSK